MEEVREVLGMISDAKKKGKKLISIKVFQSKAGEKHPTVLYIRKGMFSGGNGEAELLKMGYKIEYSKQTESCTNRYTRNGVVWKTEKISTTMMNISWN